VLPELFIIVYFTYVHPSPGARAIGYNICLAAQFILLGNLVLRNGTKESRLPRYVMAGLYYVWAVNDLFRSGRIERIGPAVSLHLTSPLEMAGPVLSILMTVMTGAGFIWLALVYLNNDLEMQSRLDPLTGLSNRHAFGDSAKGEVLRARRYRSSLSVIIFDLDCFKEINDTHGHQAGDAALIVVATCMQKNLREVDILGRFGGDEFVVILPDTNVAQACLVSERLRAKIAEAGMERNGERVNLTASFGVATLSGTDATWEDTLARGDRLLYQAKRNGRNRVECAEA
jgi:diguanylate cyclase (GGDEF)-like protein